MDARVKLVLSSVEERFADDFVSAKGSISAPDGEKVFSVEPVWGEEQVKITLKPGKSSRVERVAIVSVLSELLSTAKSFELIIRERVTELKIEFQKGKVTTKLSQVTSTSPAVEQHHGVESVVPGTRQSFIKAHEARELLQAIGIMTADGQIKGDKRRKLYQIDRFVELVSQMLSGWPDHQELTVLDCGCGKSYLSFVLNYYLHEKLRKKCYFIGIDNNQKVIEASAAVQRQLNYRNMEFIAADVRSYQPRKRPDLVLSLHACDTATDQAISLGIHAQAKYIIAVPCCQVALNNELDFGAISAITRHNVFKTRFADLLTDGLRTLALEAHGYRVSVAEYISPLDTPKNIMIRAERTDQQPSTEVYGDVKRLLGVTPWIDRLLDERKVL